MYLTLLKFHYHNFSSATSSTFICQITCIATNCFSDNGYPKAFLEQDIQSSLHLNYLLYNYVAFENFRIKLMSTSVCTLFIFTHKKNKSWTIAHLKVVSKIGSQSLKGATELQRKLSPFNALTNKFCSYFSTHLD